jgi:hypothetical protein
MINPNDLSSCLDCAIARLSEGGFHLSDSKYLWGSDNTRQKKDRRFIRVLLIMPGLQVLKGLSESVGCR